MKTIKLMLLFSFFACLMACGEKKDSREKTPIRVKTEMVAKGKQGDARTYVGVVEESEATAVSFTSMGVVRRMAVSEGQYVSRGQLLAEIDPTTSSNSVTAAQAMTSQANDMVSQAQDVYAQAKDAYDRMKILHDNGSLPEIKWVEMETRLRQAETALKSAQSGVKSAKATEQIARKGLSDTRLFAPVSGVIGKKMVGAGETALPSQAVVTILNINTVKVKVSVPEVEMKAITAATPSVVHVEAIGQQLRGGTIEKGVQADALTHTYDIRILVPNPDHQLLPGMVADVSLLTRPTAIGDTSVSPENSTWAEEITLPLTCVQRKADGSLFVWTIDKDKQAHRTAITIGPAIGNRVAVTSGIKTGDRIVVEGYQKLSEGSKTVYE